MGSAVERLVFTLLNEPGVVDGNTAHNFLRDALTPRQRLVSVLKARGLATGET